MSDAQTALDDEFEAHRAASEEATEEPKTEEPKVEESAASEEPKPPETVPLATFLEVKSQLRDSQRTVADLTENTSRFNQRLEELKANLTPKPEEIKFDDDPLGAVSNKLDKVDERFDKLEGNLTENRRQQQALQFQRNVQMAEERFVSDHPDYYQAVNHIRERRIAQYEMIGNSNPVAAFEQEAANVLYQAVTAGKNPAQVVYDLAKDMGYTKPQIKNGEIKRESVKEIADKVDSAKSLSGTSGGPAKTGLDDMTAQDLMDLSDDEFDKMLTGPDGDKRWKQMMG